MKNATTTIQVINALKKAGLEVKRFGHSGYTSYSVTKERAPRWDFRRVEVSASVAEREQMVRGYIDARKARKAETTHLRAAVKVLRVAGFNAKVGKGLHGRAIICGDFKHSNHPGGNRYNWA